MKISFGNKMELEDLVNLSITQTMGRSIHTTVTTVLAMATVCIVCIICGVTSILSFAFPLIIGMISGVYSSNCIAPHCGYIEKTSGKEVTFRFKNRQRKEKGFKKINFMDGMLNISSIFYDILFLTLHIMDKSAVSHGDSSVLACYIMVKNCHT